MSGWDVQTEQCPDTGVVFCSFQGNQDRIYLTCTCLYKMLGYEVFYSHKNYTHHFKFLMNGVHLKSRDRHRRAFYK